MSEEYLEITTGFQRNVTSDLETGFQRTVTTTAGLPEITNASGKSFGGGGDQYTMEEVLGEGSYGSVYRCTRARGKVDFAVKVIDTKRIGFVGGEVGMKAAEIMAVREVDALRQLSSHPAVISLEAAYVNKVTRQIFIVMELVPGGHLFSHIVQRHTPLKEPEASHIFAQLSDALCFCHALGVVHRDMKLENILVESIEVQLVEELNADTGALEWLTVERFTVKMCDFGFAKSLQAYTTRTPIGSGNYAAPEINLGHCEKNLSGYVPDEDMNKYDAFKADSFSLGVMVFVMLCLGFPSKDKNNHTYRSHKLWPTLSDDAHSLIDGLLENEPADRLSAVQASNHQWVRFIHGDDEHSERQRNSKQIIARYAPDERATNPKPPAARPRHDDQVVDHVIALHRALVHVQQERGMACWALASDTGIGGISCFDQLQWHVQLTEKRISEAKELMNQSLKEEGLRIDELFALLTEARKRATDAVRLDEKDPATLRECFDRVFDLYNQASGKMTDIVASSIVAFRGENNAEGRRAARRYRLYSSAAEQLGRERAFICAHRNGERLGLTDLSAKPDGLPAVSETASSWTDLQEEPASERLYRLAEIIGARKILLGTVVDATSGDATAMSEGLLATLIWEDEGSLLSSGDIALLERLEGQVLHPAVGQAAPTEEWYQTISQFLHEIHSRITMLIVEEVQVPLKSRDFPAPNTEREAVSASVFSGGCGCRKGLKRLLQSLASAL